MSSHINHVVGIALLIVVALISHKTSASDSCLCMCGYNFETAYVNETTVSSCKVCDTDFCEATYEPHCSESRRSSGCDSVTGSWDGTFNVVADNLGEYCDTTTCCCISGSVTFVTESATSLRIKAKLSGTCAATEIDQSFPVSFWGNIVLVIPSFIGGGRAVISRGSRGLGIQRSDSDCLIALAYPTNVGLIVGVIAGVAGVVLIVSIGIFCWWRRRRNFYTPV